MKLKCKEKREKKRKNKVKTLDFINSTEEEIYKPQEGKAKKIVITRSFTRDFNLKELGLQSGTYNRSFTSVRGSF